ncbi:MAG TPA: PBP1A family penicillin-binding protein [Gaiellaceae bacterium]|nr:PBP1A family penicillin-binding protein [Gaiellaceae bacterium]
MLFRRSKTPKPRRRRIRKLRALVLLLVVGLLSMVAFTYGLVMAIASEIPRLDPANQANNLSQDGYVYASDGKTILAVLRGEESRVIVTSDQIAPVVKQAIVAVEDRRYWEHRGVDVRGIARAVWSDLRHKEVVQGGSTITQQFVKNTVTQNDRTISRKLKEAALAWQLERLWSKDRILTAYLNTIFFGNGAYGIQMAARVYFDKPALDLTLAEAALLAGIPANPSAYDPVTSPRTARARRDTVLGLMRAQGLVTRADYEKALEAPLPRPEDVRIPGAQRPAQYFAEYVKQQLIPYYGSGKVFGGGLRIQTSIDLELQNLARDAIGKWLPDPKGPAAALVAIDPRDGRVLAMVGGNSYRKSQFNLAVQGERQSGSSFKPFVLAAALAEGISPVTSFTSKPTLINLGDKLWSVHNYEGSYLGTIDLTKATVFSDNSVYAQLTAQVGPKNVARMAHALGVNSRLNDYFGIGLGVEAVNPLEMARAFSTFANNGARVDGRLLGNVPRAVLWVGEDCKGRTTRLSEGQCKRISENTPTGRQVLDPNKAATVTSILSQVVRDGTGQRAALVDRPVAGKTGTTENYGDAWFVGYTPQLAVAVWVGYPSTLRSMETEFHGDPVAGGTFPALIWKTFAQSALRAKNEAPELFPAPLYESAAPYEVVYRNNRWLLDNGNCEDTHQVMYVSGSAPERQASCKPNEVDVPRVVGASLEDAKARLARTPLEAQVVTRPAKTGERIGYVVAQFPARGTLSSYATVRLLIPRALHGVVPDLIGLTIEQARVKLRRNGLGAIVEASGDGEPGIVLGQSLEPGIAAGRDATIRLVVARG